MRKIFDSLRVNHFSPVMQSSRFLYIYCGEVLRKLSFVCLNYRTNVHSSKGVYISMVRDTERDRMIREMHGEKEKIKKRDLPEIRQREICRGAMQILRKKKFHAASMREIAEATGMSLGNLYHYIHRKEDILVFIYEDLMDQIRGCFDGVIRSHESPVEQLAGVIRELFGLACRMKDETLVILTEARSLEKKDLQELLRQESSFVSAIEDIIKRGVTMRVFRCENSNLLANMIAFNIWIIPLRGWNILARNDEKEVVNQIIRCFLAELGVSKIPADEKVMTGSKQMINGNQRKEEAK
jgi:AcrR family transcriptional regulator